MMHAIFLQEVMMRLLAVAVSGRLLPPEHLDLDYLALVAVWVSAVFQGLIRDHLGVILVADAHLVVMLILAHLGAELLAGRESQNPAAIIRRECQQSLVKVPSIRLPLLAILAFDQLEEAEVKKERKLIEDQAVAVLVPGFYTDLATAGVPGHNIRALPLVVVI